MIKRRYILVALGVISALLGSLLYSSVISAPGGEYDPWLDYNEDGIVDVNDLHSLSQAYSSSGDPTKNVNVMNWPIANDVSVWYGESVEYPDTLTSIIYNASGFSHLHVLVRVTGLTGAEEVNFRIQGCLWNAAHNAFMSIHFTNYRFRGTDPTPMERLHFDRVPSETFRFSVEPTVVTTVCLVYVSFYLIWS